MLDKMNGKRDNLMRKIVFYLILFTVAGILFIFRKTYLGAFINSYLLFLMPGLLLARFALKDFSGFEKTVLSYSIGQAVLLIIFKTIGAFVEIENVFIWSMFYSFLFLVLISTKYEKGYLKHCINIALNRKGLVIFSCLLYSPFICLAIFEISVNGVYDFQGNLILPQADFAFYEAMAMTNEMLRSNLHFPFEIPHLAGTILYYPWGAYFNVALLSRLNKITTLTGWKIFSALNVIHLFLMVTILFKRLLRPLRLNAYFVAVLIFLPFFYVLGYYVHYFVNFQSRGTGHLVYLAFLLVLAYCQLNRVGPYIILGMLAGLTAAYTPKPAITLHVAIGAYILICGLRSLRTDRIYILRKLPFIFSILVVWFLAGGDIISRYLCNPKYAPVSANWEVVRMVLTIVFVFYPLYFYSGICFMAYLRRKIQPINDRLVIFSFLSVITGISLGLLPYADFFFPRLIPLRLASLIHAHVNNFMVVNILVILLISLYYTCFLLRTHTQEFLRIFRRKLVLLVNVLMLGLGLALWAANKLQYDWVPRGRYNNSVYLLICLFFIIFYVSLVCKKQFVYKHLFLTAIVLVSPYFICDTKGFVNYHRGFISRYIHPGPSLQWAGFSTSVIRNEEIALINWIGKNIPKDSIFIGSYLGFKEPNAIMAFSECRMFLAYKWNLPRHTNYDFSKRVEFIEQIYEDSIFDYQSLIKLDLKTCGYALFFDFKRDSRKNYEKLKVKYSMQLKVRYEDDNFAILYYGAMPGNMRRFIPSVS